MTRFGTSAFLAAALMLAGPSSALRSAAQVPCTRDTGGMASDAQAIACQFFNSPALSETRALVVVQDGRPAIELYAAGYGPQNRFISWSMAKSVTATLVGQLVAREKLKLDAPAPVPAWHARPGDPRSRITLRQLLTMESGLQHFEASDTLPEDPDTNRILFSDRAQDAAGFSTAKPLEAPPGTHHEYSTATSVILADVVQRTAAPGMTAAARRQAMRDHMLAYLIRPAGLSSLVCEFDAAGTMLGGSLCHATARDWARFGQLYLDGGKVNGVQVVPAQWIDFVRTPSRLNHGYGGHFWLNLPRRRGRGDALFPTAPGDAYAAIGHLGQYVVIVPSKRLVVVRLGKTADPALEPVRKGIAKLVNAFPNAA